MRLQRATVPHVSCRLHLVLYRDGGPQLFRASSLTQPTSLLTQKQVGSAVGQRQQASRQRQFQLVADEPLINMKDSSWCVNVLHQSGFVWGWHGCSLG